MRTLDIHISRLRKKLDGTPASAPLPKIGYRLESRGGGPMTFAR